MCISNLNTVENRSNQNVKMSDKEYLNSKKCKCCGIGLNKVKKSEIRQISSQDLVDKLNYRHLVVISYTWGWDVWNPLKSIKSNSLVFLIFKPNAKRVPTDLCLYY